MYQMFRIYARVLKKFSRQFFVACFYKNMANYRVFVVVSDDNLVKRTIVFSFVLGFVSCNLKGIWLCLHRNVFILVCDSFIVFTGSLSRSMMFMPK